MTSRRMLKKKINVIVNNIIEECYNVQINDKEKDVATNKIIDETVLFFDDLLTRVHAAKEISDDGELKKHYDAINSDLEKTSLTLINKLNKV